MKKTLIAVCRFIIKAIYPLVKAKRNIVKRLRVAYKKPLRSKKAANIDKAKPVTSRMELKNRGKSKQISPGKPVSESAAESRVNANKKPLWKDRRVIISACALVVLITVVLSVSLPGKGNNVYASNDETAAGSETPETTPQYVSLNVADSIKGGVSGAETGLNSEPSKTPEPSNTPSPTPIPTTAPDIPDLVPGCHDVRIIEIQQRLMELDYMEPDEPTDYYGPITAYSLQLFQRKHNLQVDGLAGAQTLTALFSSDAKPYTVKLDDRGSDVKLLQDRLKELGYLKSKASGYFGTDTEKAVKDFQKRNGLTADGSVGSMTREVLFSEDAKEAPKPKPPAKTSKPGTSSGGSGSGSGSADPPPSKPTFVPNPDGASVSALIEFAKTLQGSKYVRGGKGPNQFDCSGFVYYCLNSVGYKIRYMTSAGWRDSSFPKISSMSDLQPGDIIYFKPHHVGIYVGNGQMIDASSGAGKVVLRSCTTSYWKSHFVCARRVF